MDESNGKVVKMKGDPNVTLRKARSWIARWKLAGGGFSVGVVETGISVTLARRVDESAGIDAAMEKAAGALETELMANKETYLMVCQLVRAAWLAQAGKKPANDDDGDDAA